MRTALCVAFVFVLAAASFAGPTDYAYRSLPSATDGTFAIVFEFPLDLGDVHNVGIGFDGDYVWVSAGDATTGTCQFYIFDDTGNLMVIYPQGAGATGWGHRDLCFDGTYMYGSYSTEIHAFDTAGSYAGYFNGPGISPCRALAYDGYYFYTCGFSEYIYRGHWDGVWGSTPAWEILSGSVVDGCYGMAYDWANACLWVTTANYSGDLLQFNMDGTPLGTHTFLPEYDIQGGCTMAGTSSWGMVLAVLQQSDPDMVTFYDVDSTTPVEDTTWSSIKAMYK